MYKNNEKNRWGRVKRSYKIEENFEQVEMEYSRNISAEKKERDIRLSYEIKLKKNNASQ